MHQPLTDPALEIEELAANKLVIPQKKQNDMSVSVVNTIPVVEQTVNMIPKIAQQQTQDEPLVIDSRDVAEMVGRTHDNVLKDIRRIIEHLVGDVKSHDTSKYFIESTYISNQNKKYDCYLLTKKGCELFSTRMTGAKGTQFAVTYIERFNEMEQQLKQTPAIPVASYMIDNPIERAKMWIEEEQRVTLETKVTEQVMVIEQKEVRVSYYYQKI